jgi:tellurite resistance protein
MARWSKAVEASIFHVNNYGGRQPFLQQYYESEAYVPQTEEDKKELEDFSFIVSVMSLLVHLAKADGAIEIAERNRIIDELMYQLEQRYFEYETLAKQFGDEDKTIVTKIFTRIVEDYERDELRLEETLRIIRKIYQHNPHKLKFIIRLCYFVALSDEFISLSEKEVIMKFAEVFDIPQIELERIETEVIEAIKKES